MIVILVAGLMKSGKTSIVSALAETFLGQGRRVSAVVSGSVEPGVEIKLSPGAAIRKLAGDCGVG